jgi:hypothetical protein
MQVLLKGAYSVNFAVKRGILELLHDLFSTPHSPFIKKTFADAYLRYASHAHAYSTSHSHP